MGPIDAWFTVGCILIRLMLIAVLVVGIIVGIPLLIWDWVSTFIGGS
jgi:hypothetical protein